MQLSLIINYVVKGPIFLGLHLIS